MTRLNISLRYLVLTRKEDMNTELQKERIGASFKGYMYATYEQLKTVFGEPYSPDELNSKTDVEWILRTPHGVATIYNYKDGKRYLGDSGLEHKNICEWHAGAKNNDSYHWLKSELEDSLLSEL